MVFDGDLRVVGDYPDPVPPAGWARIRVHLAGICATDLAILQGYKGWRGILGHEFVGTVDAVGSAGDVDWVDRRVVGEINVGCGRCGPCQAGVKEHCRARRVLGILGLDGAFATWCLLPVANLHPVPDGVPDEVAVFAEPLAAALQVLEQVHLPPSGRAAVVGDGRLGCLVAQALALTGADVALAGRHPDRLAWLAERGVRPVAPGETFPLVVECTGSPAGLAAARALVAPRGKLVLKSTHLTPPPLEWAGIMVDEVAIVGSRCGPMAAALRHLAAGRIDVAPMVAAVYPLEQAPAALAAARGRLKVLLRPQ